ncbi:hypothetical protein QQF64_024433 [Cirrhinus molitorella]|uniref:Uncharacterized protein n=1 Tax=Cirrhinus molitorella TaxID=172907 RepID=A0ABR3NLH4_9TELE
MAPGCHWVSGANPGGQTRLSDSPGTEMSSDAKVSQLHSLKWSHFVGREVMKSVFEECWKRAEQLNSF